MQWLYYLPCQMLQMDNRLLPRPDCPAFSYYACGGAGSGAGSGAGEWQGISLNSMSSIDILLHVRLVVFS